MNLRKLVALFCLCTVALGAQDAPSLGETIDVSIANIDVFVTDRDGNRVRGLTRDDFEIYENGARKEISNFAEYASTAGNERVGAEGGAEAEQVVPRQKRTMLIFLEQMRLPKHSADPLVAELKNVIRQTIEPGDAVSVVMWSRSGGITQVELTEDLEPIDAMLEHFGESTLRAQISDAQQVREHAAAMRQFIADVEAGLGSTGTGGQSSEATAVMPMLVAYGEMKARVAAITSAIHSIAGIEGKKVMLLLTRRLGEVAGIEYAYAADTPTPAHLRQRFGTERLMQELVDAANAGGVTVYPLYAPGLGHAIPDAASNLRPDAMNEWAIVANERVSMREIASRTGGLTADSTKDIVALLPRIASDVTDYYSLAYRVDATGKDSARDITVKTRNRDYVVRARRQFVEKSDESRMRDRLRATLFRASHDSPIRIEAQLGAARGSRTLQTVPLRIRIPISALTVIPQDRGKHAGSFSVHIGTAADLDELSEVTRKTQPFELDEKNLVAAQSGFFTYDVDVKVNAKARYLAVGVFDEVSKDYGLARVALPAAEGR
ncbi:MAG TPA: VWA domain-containing protein [Thermoanaerobaculia bacterium]|nr:VWA domain-containing protein [Thermoanaerobaculia bacterium]